eukprot:107350-Chlamydomonas_euryale.AAC.3
MAACLSSVAGLARCRRSEGSADINIYFPTHYHVWRWMGGCGFRVKGLGVGWEAAGVGGVPGLLRCNLSESCGCGRSSWLAALLPLRELWVWAVLHCCLGEIGREQPKPTSSCRRPCNMARTSVVFSSLQRYSKSR